MNITIFGTGYVGLVTGACLAELGNHVICVDINPDKIEQLRRGESPIYEPGLPAMLQRNIEAKRIEFTTNPEDGIKHAQIHFIAVGTPPVGDGSADLSAVFTVAETIGEHLTDYGLVITKSTVPVGTADQLHSIIKAALAKRNVSVDVDIASNPEFLREGAAIKDFMNPDRIIVGADTQKAADLLRELYMPLIDAGQRFIVMDVRSSELTKYASNAFLATKISFMNEMSQIAERLGADIEHVRRGMSLDPRIGEYFLNAGCGYGGSCFPKDVQALQKTAEDCGFQSRILPVVEQVNIAQKRILFQKIKRYFNNDIRNKVVAIWGLAFKPNTDDMRDASSRVLMEALWQAGAKVRAYDPIAMSNTQDLYSDHPSLELCETAEAALDNADVLAIATEWEVFQRPDFNLIKSKLRHPAIFDGRNIYEPQQVTSQGLRYYGIGRGEAL